jgi:hypothetical protein
MNMMNENTEMTNFDENTMKFVESDWHHAYLSYFKLTPSQNNNYSDIEISQSDIMNIIKIYDSNPPRGNKYYRQITYYYMQRSLLEAEYEKSQLMNDLEKKGEKACIDLMSLSNDKSNKKDICNLLQNIMSEGSKEFKEKTGKEMTYSEMRQMYG